MSEGIQIKASRYYRRWLGGQERVPMEVGGPLTLAEVLQRLAQQVDGFPTLPLEVGRLQAEVLIYDGARFLRPGDTVRPGTILELLPPTAGG